MRKVLATPLPLTIIYPLNVISKSSTDGTQQSERHHVTGVSMVLARCVYNISYVYLSFGEVLHVAVSCKNPTLFCCIFRPHYHIRSTLAQDFQAGSYALHKLIRHSCTYTARISPTLKEVLHHSISNAIMWSKYATE